MYRGKCPSSQAAISKTEKNADLRKTFENFNIQAHVNPNREMHEQEEKLPFENIWKVVL